MKNTLFAIFATFLIAMLFSGCMGTFETARVVPFKAGVTYFTTFNAEEGDSSATADDNSFSIPGIILEAGWPAGPSRFGIGLHLKTGALLKDNDSGIVLVWGGKLQIPENSLADFAIGIDIWSYVPGEIKLFVSRRFGIVEPYVIVGVADFLSIFDDDNDNSINIFRDNGLVSYTIGTMVEFGKGSGWMFTAEVEAGDVWVSPGLGLALIREF